MSDINVARTDKIALANLKRNKNNFQHVLQSDLLPGSPGQR